MLFGVVGDIHGDFDALERAMRRRADLAFWLSVGDVASDDGEYPEPIAPLYWIKGNNEDFEFIAMSRPEGRNLRVEGEHPNLHFLANATKSNMDGVAVAALGGTFAPTWYDTPAAVLPGARKRPSTRARDGSRVGTAVTGRDDKRRHFVREEVEACERMRGVDVLLTHEAPRPFIVEAGAPRAPGSRPRRLDAGKVAINGVLRAMQPRLHFFGHHHRFTDSVREGVRSIGLDLVSRSFVLVDAASFACEWIDMESS